MSFAKIALFAFGLAVVLVGGGVNADAAARVNRSHPAGWTNSYYPNSDEEARFDHAKGVIN